MVHICTINFIALFVSIPHGYWLEWRCHCLNLGGRKQFGSLAKDPCLALAGWDYASYKQGGIYEIYFGRTYWVPCF